MRRAVLGILLVLALPREALADASLASAAKDVAHDLGEAPAGCLVVAGPVASDIPAPRGDELAVKVASLVAGALGHEARASDHTAALGSARALAGKRGGLVYLDIHIGNGSVALTADLYATTKNAWDRLRAPNPPPSAHAFTELPVTAETRSYLAPRLLEHVTVTKFGQGVGSVLALACGDLDGDGGNDLAVVTEDDVAWGDLEGKRFVARRRARAETLGRRLPVPMREPFASAVIVPADLWGALYVAWGDRAGSVVGPDLVPKGALRGAPFELAGGPVCFKVDAEHGEVAGPAFECLGGASRPSAFHSPFDAAASDEVVAKDGSSAWVSLTRDASGQLYVGERALEGVLVGAELAVADLDQDGLPEVLTTQPNGPDAIVLSTLKGDALEQKARWEAPAGVDAVAACPPEADDAPALVVAVGNEIWLVR